MKKEELLYAIHIQNKEIVTIAESQLKEFTDRISCLSERLFLQSQPTHQYT